MMALRRIAATAGLLAAVSLGSCSASARDPVEITVDPAVTHQVMNGWETTTRLWEYNKAEDRFDGSWVPISGQIYDKLVNELGINRVRIELKSGAENPVDYWSQFEAGKIGYKAFRRHYYEKINDDADPNQLNPAGVQFSHLDYQIEKMVLPIKQRVEANGEKLFINLNYVDFGQTELKGDISHARQPAEYAELIDAAFVHLKDKYGIVPDSLEVILEPDNSDHWRGRQIGEAIVATHARLKADGFDPQFIAPSTASAGRAPAFFDEMMAVPGVAPLISTLSYHRYDSPKPAVIKGIAESARSIGLSNSLIDRVSPVPGIAERAKENHISTAMLEHLSGDAAELFEDLTVGQVSAWQQYDIARKDIPGEPDEGGDYYVVAYANPNAPVIRMADRTRGLAQYFRYVRIGATRVDARSNDGDVKPVAFKNRDGGFVVVVNADRARNLIVGGLPPGRYLASYTTAKETGRELPPIVSNGTIKLSIPAAGILTVRSQSNAAPNRSAAGA
ncbi:hypothetical protein GCM10023264_09590 [Sphingomonas daechungensis]|uniref:hypothetical protein n=1 Tax=Sphingomonas daechungensis TaxID=1176646 RepID=UPI0031E614AC